MDNYCLKMDVSIVIIIIRISCWADPGDGKFSGIALVMWH